MAGRAPAGLTATGGSNYVALSWTDPGDGSIEKYQLQRKESGGAWDAWADIAGSGAATVDHTVTGLSSSAVRYDFRLRAVNAIGPGPSAEAGASTTGAKPGQAGGVFRVGVTNNRFKFVLYLHDPDDPASRTTSGGFRIQPTRVALGWLVDLRQRSNHEGYSNIDPFFLTGTGNSSFSSAP